MILEFLDGSQLEVLNVFGSPRLVMGVMRDTLRIEVDPKTIGFDELKSKFKDNPQTKMLYTYLTVARNDEPDEDAPLEKVAVGEGYSIFVSISNEQRAITTPPGVLAPVEYEEIYAVTIAQMTYQERLLSTAGESPITSSTQG